MGESKIMNELKQNLTRFLDYAVKHLNLDPEKWTIETEQDNIVLETDDGLESDLLTVFLSRNYLPTDEFPISIEPERVTKWFVKHVEIATSCGVD